jgi:hypothetical protein
MSDLMDGSFTAREIAEYYGVPVTLVRRIVDRIGLGVRFRGSRFLFQADVETVGVVLKGMNKLPRGRLDESTLTDADPITEVLE